MKLEKKMTIYMLILVLIAMFLMQFIFFRNSYKLLNSNKKRVLNSYAYVLSKDPIIIKNLSKQNQDTLDIYMASIWPKLINLNYVIIMDLKGEVFSYKNKNNSPFLEKNYKSILEQIIDKPIQYYNLDPDNNFLQEFMPIIYRGKLIGMLGVQEYHHKNEDLKNIFFIEVFVAILIVIVMSILFSVFLAKNIKKQIFGYEPLEFAHIYAERQILFDHLSDKIVTINSSGKLTKANKIAKEKLHSSDEIILRKLYDEIISKNITFDNREIILTNQIFFITAINIIQENNDSEVLFIIKQGKKIKKLAREITGVTQIINSMRANVHEFKNKIHVISGLLRLEEYEELKKYISTIKNELDNENKEIEGINDPIISALLLTKISLAKEKQITLTIDEMSNLMKIHGSIKSDNLIVIIGNLIENATESFDSKDIDNKEILLQILEDSKQILIQISDNSGLIEGSHIDKIFEIGYSSKGEGRGSGLALIKNLVKLYNGNIEIINKENYKTFYIKLNKG